MNALDEVLNTIKVRSSVYCPIEVGAPWGLIADPVSGKISRDYPDVEMPLHAELINRRWNIQPPPKAL